MALFGWLFLKNIRLSSHTQDLTQDLSPMVFFLIKKKLPLDDTHMFIWPLNPTTDFSIIGLSLIVIVIVHNIIKTFKRKSYYLTVLIYTHS